MRGYEIEATFIRINVDEIIGIANLKNWLDMI